MPTAVSKVRSLAHVRPVPPELEAAYNAHDMKWSDWTAPVQLTQEDVDTASRLFDDRNPIHRADSEFPIVQGTLTFASVTRYLGDLQSLMSVDGHVLVLKRLLDVEFTAIVPVGAQIQCSYRLIGLQAHQSGPMLSVEFQIRIVQTQEVAVVGAVALTIWPERLLRLLAERAHRKL